MASRHERRHSFDSSSMNFDYNDDSNHSSGDEYSKSRRVRFHENRLRGDHKYRSRSYDKYRGQNKREMTVQETTKRLKDSYNNIELGLNALQKVYEDLLESRENVKCQMADFSQKVSVSEIETLMAEVKNLEKSLKKSGCQKREYLDELSKLQSILHEDRMKMESFVRASNDSKRFLRVRMDQSTKMTRDQQALITKLKRDNEYLWKVLREIQQHLKEEEESSFEDTNQHFQKRRATTINVSATSTNRFPGFLDAPNNYHGTTNNYSRTSEARRKIELYGTPRHLPNIPPPPKSRRDESGNKIINFDIKLSRMKSRDEPAGDSCSNRSSSTSSYISEKVHFLIKQTESIQKMISDVGNKKHQSKNREEKMSYRGSYGDENEYQPSTYAKDQPSTYAKDQPPTYTKDPSSTYGKEHSSMYTNDQPPLYSSDQPPLYSSDQPSVDTRDYLPQYDQQSAYANNQSTVYSKENSSSVYMQDQPSEYRKEFTSLHRIPSENEQGIRSDSKDIIQRCEDLEKRVEQCSTKDLRQRLIKQLDEIDKHMCKGEMYHTKDRKYRTTSQHNNQHQQQYQQQRQQQDSVQQPAHINQWHPEVHKKVRSELFKCLDQMSVMERNFSNAQDEIARLRHYIKETSDQKEFSEKTFKREAMQLRMVVEEKSKEVEALKTNLNEAIEGLKSSEKYLQEIEELEKTVEDKDHEIEEVKKECEDECTRLKANLREKTEELETIRIEMRGALESMEKLRITTKQQEQNLEKIQFEDTIGTEISLLQTAINEVDQKMRALAEENIMFKHEIESKNTMLNELSLENETLVSQLQVCQTELKFMKTNFASLDAERNISTYFQQDLKIQQLEHDLTKALSEKELMMNSTFRRSENPSEEQQVIVSLLDDNEKYLDIIQQKDRLLEQQQKQLKELESKDDVQGEIDELLEMVNQQNTKYEAGDKQDSYTKHHQQQLKYLEIIKRKNKTIEELRANLEKVNAEADKKLINELLTTLSSNKKGGKQENDADIKEELEKIQSLLSSSHCEMIDKIFTLEGMLSALQKENKGLRKELGQSLEGSPEKAEDLQQKFQRVMEENSTLRENLNRPYPGLVQNILSQTEEVKKLQEENELLRLGLNNNRRELVDSNLRKRQRIRELQLRIEEMEQKNEHETDTTNHTLILHGEERPDKSPEKRMRRKVASEEVLAEMKNQNKLLQRMEEENNKLTEKSQDQAKEISKLKAEIERLEDYKKAKKALEIEVKNLRSALHDISDEEHKNQQKIRELQEEVQSWKENSKTSDYTYDDGFTPSSTPDRSRLSLGSFEKGTDMNPKTLYAEFAKVKKECEKSNEDVRRLSLILDKEKSRSERLEDKIGNLEAERRNLEKSLMESEQQTQNINEELQLVENHLQKSQNEGKKAKNEISSLRKVIEDISTAQQNDEGANEMIKVLSNNLRKLEQERESLGNNIDQLTEENNQLEKELKSLRNKASRGAEIRELQGENEKQRSEIIELTNHLDQQRENNVELQDINEQLVEQLEKIKSDVNETQFKEWLDKDVQNRLALLSPDTHRSDLGLDQDERQYKKDQQRIIRKLQIENQIMKAKLFSQEEEQIAATQIVSDMERGHGHLTGTLRCHLILQKNSTAKLLEGSLQQYTKDFEILQRKFTSLEEKYNRSKDKTKRRDDIWDLFTNAAATITNINTILTEGLVKVEEDLEKELQDNEFHDKDYKSRLWILRRRLSDVENRHRELQLRAEELNLRLDAKTTEFEVTQDELEDATRDLESRDSHLDKLKKELDKATKEREKLNRLMNILKQNDCRTVGEVIKEIDLPNDSAMKENIDCEKQQQGTSAMGKNTNNVDLTDLINKLNERDAALNVMRRMRDETEKENDELKRRVNYLERKLKEVTEQRDKLQKEAEYRAGYMSFARDDHGTIHMLRDDLKRLTNENADLKHDITLKQRQMYDMSKDLNRLRIQLDLDSTKTEKKFGGKEDKMIQDLAELKADKFMLETKLKDAERRLGPAGSKNTKDIDLVEIFKQKLSEKEHEIEKLKRSPSRTSAPSKSPLPGRDDTMSDIQSAFDSSMTESKQQLEIKKKMQDLKNENKVLKEAVADKGLRGSADYIRRIKGGEKKIEQLRTEVTQLNADNEKKRTRIKELLTAIEDMKGSKQGTATKKSQEEKLTNLIEKTKEDEMESVLEKLQKSKTEVEEWKNRAENYEKELSRIQTPTQQQPQHSSVATEANEQNMESSPIILQPESTLDEQQEQQRMELPRTPTRAASSDGVYKVLESKYSSVYDTPRSRPTSSNQDNTDGSDKKGSGLSKIPSPLKRQKPLAKNFGNKSPEEIQKSAQRRKWDLPDEKENPKSKLPLKKKPSDSQVRDLNLQIAQLQNELDIYKTNLQIDKQNETLDILGSERLNYVIDYQVSKRCMDEIKELQNEIYTLQHENERLHNNYVELAQTVDVFNESVNSELKEVKQAKVRQSDRCARENSALHEIIKAKNKHVENLEKENKMLVARIEDMKVEQTMKIQMNEGRTDTGNNYQLENQNNLMKIIQEDLAAKNEKIQKKYDTLAQKNEEITQTLQALMLDKETLEGRLISADTTEEELKDKSEQCTKLQRKLKEHENNNKKIITELKSLKTELNNKTEKSTQLSEDLKKKSEECAKLHRRLKDNGMNGKASELKSVKTELVNKTKELQEINEKLQRKIEDYNKLQKRLQQEKNRKVVEQSVQKDDLVNELQSLKSELTHRSEIESLLRAELETETDKHKGLLEERESFERKEKNYQDMIQRLQSNNSIKDTETEATLQEAAKALEMTKQNLQIKSGEREALQHKLRAAENDLEKEKQSFKDIQHRLTQDIERVKDEFTRYKEHALVKINKLENENRSREENKQNVEGELAAFKNEFTSYKKNTDEEIKKYTEQIAEREKEIKEYKGLLDRAKIKQSSRGTRANNELNLPAISEELIVSEESLNSEAIPIPETDVVEGQLFVPANDLEIEIEILQGCNEEMEQEIESLKIEIKTLEDTKVELTNELQRTKEDLNQTLEYLRDINDKNEELACENEKITRDLQNKQQEVSILHSQFYTQGYELEEKSSKKELKFENQLRRLDLENKQHSTTIEQMEEAIDKLEQENNRKDTAFEKLKRNNETNITELESVIKDLEDEIKLRSEENDRMRTNRTQLQLLIGEKDEQLRKLLEINESLEQELSRKSSKSTANEKRQQQQDAKKLPTISEELGDKSKKSEKSVSESEVYENKLKIIELEGSLATWIRKASEQADEINRLNEKIALTEATTTNIAAEKYEITDPSRIEYEQNNNEYLSKQIDKLRDEIETKNTKLQSLQDELHDKDTQYSRVLTSLNKRREESKTFLAMQQTLREEIDKKEDLIRKLKFKIKSKDMDASFTSLNMSRDLDFDQSEADIDARDLVQSELELDVEVDDEIDGIPPQNDVLLKLTNQLSSSRRRNRNLSNQLEECRKDYVTLKEQNERIESNNRDLCEEVSDYKEKLTELRGIIQCSPDIPSDSTISNNSQVVGIKSKLYASYKELREKSIEIASLHMCMEIKDEEISGLHQEIQGLKSDLQPNVESSSVSKSSSSEQSALSRRLNEYPDDLKALLHELNERDQNEYELQRQITELRERLIEKSRQSDCLQNELSKVRTRFRDIEQKLCQEDKRLREKFIQVFEDDENSELSEVTPLTSLKMLSAPSQLIETSEREKTDNQTLNETFTIEEIDDAILAQTSSYKERLECLESEKLKSEEETLFYKGQVDNLRSENKRLTEKNKNQQQRLTQNEDTIRHLQNDVKNQQTADDANREVAENGEKETSSDDSMKILETRLHLKEKRHLIELENLKESLLNARNEHVQSIRKKMETSFEEKIFYQMKTKKLEEILERKDKEIVQLKSKFIY